MNLEKALKILNITGEVTESKVKKQYNKMALGCHPDKNNSAGGAERFHACNNAYVFLQQHLDVEIEDTNHNYLSLFKKCIRTCMSHIDTCINETCFDLKPKKIIPLTLDFLF